MHERIKSLGHSEKRSYWIFYSDEHSSKATIHSSKVAPILYQRTHIDPWTPAVWPIWFRQRRNLRHVWVHKWHGNAREFSETFFEACFSGDETKLRVMVIKSPKLLTMLLIIMINMRSKRKTIFFPEIRVTRKVFTWAATIFLTNLIEFLK